MDQIGFVILSHNHPQQLLRLVRCLQRLYDNPPIAIHHDIGQSPIRERDFPSGVKFVSPHLSTRWGRFANVIAALRALELLYDSSEPKWFFFLSGADYPIMSASKVFNELSSAAVDALMDYREVQSIEDDVHSVFPPENPSLKYYASSHNLAKAWHRYIGLNVWLPIVRKGPRLGRHTFYLSRKAWRSPFGPKFKCFYGDTWFAGNSKVARILLNPVEAHLRLRRHLRLRDVPSECYYQTVIANTDGLKISTATRRFSEWIVDGDAHPKILDSSDLTPIIQSKAYFARKFVPDSPVLDEIDKLLL
jgi:hypothetical protein